ncbi:SRPBCC domain-containing protein [Streptomyces sp. NPDC000345]|uniref:SRPBCC family protein n=1 Tax=Streptomyces sp. NPDC000345 TaxID=3364537 RepID=UPI003675E134
MTPAPRDTTPTAVHCDQFLPHPPSAVWKALTEADPHARWWAAGDVRPVVGHRFTLDMGPWGEQPCEVLDVDPERLLRYSFADGSLDTTITWRLEPEGTGTRLFLTHDGFDLDSPLGRAAFEGMGQGWPHVLSHLTKTLDEA